MPVVSNLSLWIGIGVGALSSLMLAFGIMAALDARYVGRREYDVALKDIRLRLDRIGRAVGAKDD